jgi:ribosomal protein S18 acetylase RimI-like enzyme
MHEGLGEVHDVGVLREMRGRGIGEALLLESFKRFRERGGDRTRLWVDTQNVTAAIKLYERIGMSVARRMHFYAKDLA